MTAGVKVRGADRLARTLRRAATDIADQSVLNAHAARDLAAAMRSRAPRRTGALAGSIQADSGPDYVRAGPLVRYGLPVEYGVPLRSQAAQPYGRPALADEAPDYIDDLGDAIGDDLRRVRGA